MHFPYPCHALAVVLSSRITILLVHVVAKLPIDTLNLDLDTGWIMLRWLEHGSTNIQKSIFEFCACDSEEPPCHFSQILLMLD